MDAGEQQALTIMAKSKWDLAVRREHNLSRELSKTGTLVTFAEQPRDVRGIGRPFTRSERPSGVRVVPRWTVLPGHRGKRAAKVENRMAKRILSRLDSQPVVLNCPWNAGMERLEPNHRYCLDLADDWAVLIPQRHDFIHDCYKRLSDGVEEIIVASPALCELFPSRSPKVIPNATSEACLEQALTPAPDNSRCVYVGTLSERLDLGVIGLLLQTLPAVTVELYGPMHFGGRTSARGAQLKQIQKDAGGRLVIRPPVAPIDLPSVLDRADILILPNRMEYSRGQDSMKLYDYLARGRPVVTTRLPRDGRDVPPGIVEASDASTFVDAVRAALESDFVRPQQRRDWAAERSWTKASEIWAGAVFGDLRLR